MNFPITADQRGTKGLRDALILIFGMMKELCPDVMILPWKEDTKKDALKTPDSIPSTITLLQKYFDGARALMPGGCVYMKVNIGFSVTADRETFQKDFEQWCRDGECWLAYLTNYTNCELLSRKLTEAFRSSTGKSVDIGK